MGMDRKIKKKKWPPRRIITYAASAIFVLVVVYLFVFKMSKSSLNVKLERITISTVEKGPFQEHIPVMGQVLPIETYFLELSEGGTVEEIYMEAGSVIEKGDQIVRLGNTNLLIDIMWREAELFQQSNNLRNTRLTMEQYRLTLSQQLAGIDNDIQQQKRTYERYKELVKDNLISDHEFELVEDQYEYLQKRRDLTVESQKNDLEFRQSQIDALEKSLERMQNNLEIIKQKQEDLTVTAPISGHLTALDAEIGQSKQPGQRLGQIDVMDDFKVRVPIDEHWLARVEKGRNGTCEWAGNSYNLEITRVYLEVTDGRFEVDMLFDGETPQGIRRGMTLHIRLELGDLSEQIKLPRGGFFQTTGGNWVFVVDEDEKIATKRTIRLGRYNSEVHEVLEGLQPGEKVITSSYESFGNIERLILKK
jgi:HlyD family secretion protein